MRVLFDEAVPERGLSAWSMERFDLEDGTEVTDSYLDLISTCYRTNMKTRTDDLAPQRVRVSRLLYGVAVPPMQYR